MSESLPKPWFDNSNAPHIPLPVYHEEKVIFAGVFMSAMLYGVTIVLFFRCMSALFNTKNRPRGTIKWPLVAHTLAMFAITTALTAIYLNTMFIVYIDDRQSPGDDGLSLPGPLIYQDLIYFKGNGVVIDIMAFSKNWLADGLLLCHCYVVYSMNYWVIAIPCLMYLASLVVGIMFTYQYSRPINIPHLLASVLDYAIPYHTISCALNIMLTLMIVTRLFLAHRNVRKAMNARVRVNGLYKVIVTSLVESCALYSVTFVLFVGLLAADSSLLNVFLPVFLEVQVIAPFLITLQIASQNASSNVTITSGSIGSIRFASQRGSTGVEEIASDGRPAGCTGTYRDPEAPPNPGVAVETTADLRED